jgi:Uma2 family endonuclease
MMSLAEWATLPEDEPGELVDGVLVEEEMPDLVHEIVVSWLVWVLRSWIERRGGFVFGSEAKFAVGPRRGRKPDLTVYLRSDVILPRHGVVRVPPDIAIEIVSPTSRDRRRDRVDKLAEYAAFGVLYYWVVDPYDRSFDVFERNDDGVYARAVSATAGTIHAPPGCQGLTIDLDGLWAEIEKLGPPDSGSRPRERFR